MAEWIEPGRAMQLTTERMVLVAREWDDGTVTVDVAPAGDGVALREPVVRLSEAGRFVVGLDARVPAGVR